MKAAKQVKIVTLDPQPNTKHKLYHRLKNVSFFKPNARKQSRYCIELHTAADINRSLIDNFLMFFNSIQEGDSQNTSNQKDKKPCFNRLFVHCVHLWLLNDKFVPISAGQSDLEQIFCQQVMGSYENGASFDYELRKEIEELYNSQKIKINRLFSLQLSKQKEKQLKDEAEWSLLLKVMHQICSHLRRQMIISILTIENPNIKNLYIPTSMKEIESIYLSNLIDQLQNFQPTRKIVRKLKLNDFVFKRYASYYGTDYAEYQKDKKYSRSHENKLLIQRNTENNREYLLNLKEMVAIRKQNSQYACQSFEILKQLAGELQKHYRITRSAYPLLDPKCVLFNQLSLKVHLSYENPLLEALGLLKKPMNVQTAICYKASPKPYDSYSWINELQHPQSFYNVLYAFDSLIYRFHEDIPHQKSHMQTMKMIKDKDGEESEIWRYLMVASYFMNGLEYHQAVNQSCLHLNDFKIFLLAQKEAIECADQAGFIQKVLGSKFIRQLYKEQPPPVQLERVFLDNLFANSEVDSLIEGMVLHKTTHFLLSRLTIAKKLIKLIEKSPFFGSIVNSLKYLVRFQVGVILELQLIVQICDCYQKDPKTGLKLHKEIQKSLIRENSHIYTQTAMNKFKEYEHRNSIKQEQQFLSLLQSYGSMYKTKETVTEFIRKTFRFLKLLASKQEINISEVQKDKKQDGELSITSLQVQAQQSLSQAKSHLKTVISQEFIRKVRNKSSGEKELMDYKVQVMVELLLQSDRGSYVTSESLIMPMLEYQESHGISLDARQLREFYEDRCEGLLYALEILKEQSHEQSFGASCWEIAA